MQGLTKYNLEIVSKVINGTSYPLHALNLLDRSPVCVDLGANIGSFALACTVWRPDARIVAVEPDPTCFAALNSNLSACDVDIDLRHHAISGHSGSLALHPGSRDGVMNSIYRGAMTGEEQPRDVATRSAKTFFDEVIQDYGSVDLLKVDIEGAEWCLLDLPESFFAAIPLIFLEYHSSRFLASFLPRLLSTHCLFSGSIRFPHRGEIALLRNDLIPADQARYEIAPADVIQSTS